MQPREFGAKVALDLRLPQDYDTFRQAGIAGVVGAGLGLGRGLIWPGYIEEKDKKGRIVAKRRRNPLLGAIEGGLFGAGSSALASYAGQTLSQYKPEIDNIVHKIQDVATHNSAPAQE
jgi:hypothetical protein